MTKLNVIGGQKPLPVGKARKLYTYQGEPRAACAIAKMRGEPNSSVQYRLEHGIDLDAPRYSIQRRPTVMRLLHNGELMTVAEIAKATGYHPSTVCRRSDGVRFFPRGEPTDPFEDNPRMPGPYHEKYELDGISDTLSGWAKRTGMNYYTLRDRIRWYGVPLRLAIKAPVTTRAQRVRIAKAIRRMAVLINKAADAQPTVMQDGSPSAVNAPSGEGFKLSPNAPRPVHTAQIVICSEV